MNKSETEVSAIDIALTTTPFETISVWLSANKDIWNYDSPSTMLTVYSVDRESMRKMERRGTILKVVVAVAVS